jgi:hypothetical protein
MPAKSKKREEQQEEEEKRNQNGSIKHNIELMLKKMGADHDNWQEVITDVLTSKIRELSVSEQFVDEKNTDNQFANEEVDSNYGYLSGYKPKNITKQIECLKKLFPRIGTADEKIASQPLPKRTEGWFAIPRWQAIAKTYSEATQKVLDLIKNNRNNRFHNYCDGKIDVRHFRQFNKTARMFQVLGEHQKDKDILIVPCQFGKYYAGCSIRRAREIMDDSEFGLNVFSIGIMLLTHPERLLHRDDVWADCAGDDLSCDGFDRAPCFYFEGDEVRFDMSDINCYHAYCGSASAQLPFTLETENI